MSDDMQRGAEAPGQTPNPTSPPAAATAGETNAARAAARGGVGGVLVGLSLLVGIAALVMSAMLWQRLGLSQQELARRSTDSAAQSTEARALAAQAEAMTQELQARLSVAELRLSEVSLQRTQLEELMLSVSRSRDDNLVQDLESALRLAQQQTQLTGSAQPLLSALQAADQRIARAAQPRLNPVQRAIARDIERIQAATLTDVPALVQRLDELARLSDELVAANAVVKQRGTPKPKAARAVAPAERSRTGEAADPGDAPGPGATGWARVTGTWNTFWTKVWDDAMAQTRDLVRVSRIEEPEAMLMAPEQAFWLRQNLKMQLLNARLALLARQLPAAQSDAASAMGAVERYFDPDNPTTRAMLRGLTAVSADMKVNELPRPDETLAALAAAAGGR